MKKIYNNIEKNPNYLIFKPVTVKDFLNTVITTDSINALNELGYYIIINGTFFPIEEIYVYSGYILVKNCSYNCDLEIASNEDNMIYHMVNKKIAFDEEVM